MCGRIGGAALWIVVIVLVCFCIGRRRFGLTAVVVLDKHKAVPNASEFQLYAQPTRIETRVLARKVPDCQWL